jgi:hypothetical protein
MTKQFDKTICANCGHLGSMHSDGNYTHTGECFTQLNPEIDVSSNKAKFCKCKKFVSKKAGKELIGGKND